MEKEVRTIVTSVSHYDGRLEGRPPEDIEYRLQGEDTYTDVAKRVAQFRETPHGMVHLHLVSYKGTIVWVVRDGHSSICNTNRCRKICIVPI